MPFPAAIIISVIIAAIVSSALVLIQGGAFPDWALLAAFCAATVLTTLVTRARPAAVQAAATARPASANAPADDRDREQGSVKWFNVSKGFGFITVDDGQEIFVHFRSIRGEGRRSLRDGQRVSFYIAQSDKGPQAEDVEPL
jgi:CspA family cold shock protein